jgi:hypothetical protein
VTPRFFAILVCLAASGRWPRLRYVAAALGCEAVADDVSSAANAAAMSAASFFAWLAPSLLMASMGALLASCSRFVIAAFVAGQSVAYAVAGAHPPSIAWVAALSCAMSAAQLARRTTPADTERVVMLALLVGNAATFALMLLFGIDDAYAKEVVSTSNDATHIAVAGLALWAMRSP